MGIAGFIDEAYIQTFFDSMSVGFAHHEIVCDERGIPVDYVFLELNPAFERLTGLKKADVLGKSVLEVIPEIEEQWVRIYGDVARNGISQTFESYERTMDKWFKVDVFSHVQGQFSVLFNDISEIKAQALSQIRYKLLLDSSSDVILFLDRDGNIQDFNKAALRAYGYEEEQLIHMNIRDLRSNDSIMDFSEQFSKALAGGSNFETVHIRKDGTEFPVEVSSGNAGDGNQQVVMSVIRDISLRKKMERELKHRAEHDVLTDIENRRCFMDEYQLLAENALRGNYRLALHLFDIDHFKHINDTYGHDAGDLVLKETAARMKECSRQVDRIARFGGDEFVFLQSHVHSEEDIQYVAEKLLISLQKPIQYNEHWIDISISLGIASFPDDAADRDSLIRYADGAMYISKKNSGGRYHRHTSSM